MSLFEESNVTRLQLLVELRPSGAGEVGVTHLNEHGRQVAAAVRRWKAPRDFIGLPDLMREVGGHWLYGPSSTLAFDLKQWLNRTMPALDMSTRSALLDSL